MRLVSIALTTYNGARFLGEQLESLARQTYPDLEVVAVDDCSTDETLAVLDSFRSRFERFRLFANKTRLGYIRNFERALSLCEGDFIALCDQDDVWVSTKVTELVDGIGNHLLVHSDAALIDEEGRLVHESLSRLRVKTGVPGFASIVVSNVVTGCTTMIRRELLSLAQPFPACVTHDHWLAIVAAGIGTMGYCSRVLTYYRQHANNAVGAVKRPAVGVPTSEKEKDGRRRFHQGRYEQYAEIRSALGNRIALASQRFLNGLVEYYGSYLLKRIRVRAFLFHLAHIRLLNEDKGPWDLIKHGATSLIGEGRRARRP